MPCVKMSKFVFFLLGVCIYMVHLCAFQLLSSFTPGGWPSREGDGGQRRRRRPPVVLGWFTLPFENLLFNVYPT